MPSVRGCNIPDDLFYDVANHIWFKPEADGTLKMGMTVVATSMAGKLLAFTPKKIGAKIAAGKSCATIESGKWVGPAKTAVAGEIVAVNADLVAKPDAANGDPYGAGWMLVLKPDNWEQSQANLTPGTAVAAPYEAKMQADGFAGCGNAKT